MSDNSSILSSLGVAAIIVLPALAPEASIIVSGIWWTLFYTCEVIAYWSFDITREIPSFVSEVGSGTWICLLVLALAGLLGGVLGVVAMIVTYAPLFLLGSFQLMYGIAVPMTQDQWIEQNYVQVYNAKTCKYPSDPFHGSNSKCEYVPKPGLKLPSFTINYINQGDHKPENIKPYAGY